MCLLRHTHTFLTGFAGFFHGGKKRVFFRVFFHPVETGFFQFLPPISEETGKVKN